jgi:hypothetical protein
MTDHFIQQQITEFACKYPSVAPKKEIARETPKVAQKATLAPAPKKSRVIQLQCTNFPKKDSESYEDSEYSGDSDDDDDSNDSDNSDDNIGSNSDSCVCDEDGKCDHHWMQEALIKYARREHAKAQITAKK